MTQFIVGFIFGIFTGAFAANKNFRAKVIKASKKIAAQTGVIPKQDTDKGAK